MGGFLLCGVVRRRPSGGAGEEDEVIFGLKDLQETKLVTPGPNVSDGSSVAVQLIIGVRELEGGEVHEALTNPFCFVFHEEVSGNLFKTEFWDESDYIKISMTTRFCLKKKKN